MLPIATNGSISIHALREEGDKRAICLLVSRLISIHALREEGDPREQMPLWMPARISIHALREEGDERHQVLYCQLQQISIHALREEGDNCAPPPCLLVPYFYPRPPRGGRPKS